MKKTLKFWKWQLDLKTKRLDVDERIGYLANELIKELKASGRSIQCNEYDADFGNLDIWVHNLTNKNATLTIGSIGKNVITTKPTFNKF